MELKFEFESKSRALPDREGTFARLIITIEVSWTGEDTPPDFKLIRVADIDRNTVVQFISLPMDEQLSIVSRAEELAEDSASEAHAEWQAAKDDYDYERYVDSMHDREGK